MNNQNDPIIDQKIIEEKKGLGWLWIIILLILLALIAWWFFSHNRANEQPVTQPATTAAVVAPQQETTIAPQDTSAELQATSAVQENSTDLGTTDISTGGLQAYFDNPSANQENNYAFDRIDFASQSAKPIVNDPAQIDQVSQMLNDHPQTQITIKGYADSTGTDNINDPLSAQRAKAVKALLVERKVAENRIHIEGEGDRNPIATNSTASGRDMNRRVTLRIDTQ